MTRRTTPFLALAASSALALTLSACGADTGAQGGATAESTATTGTASSSPTQEATQESAGTVEVENNLGTATVPVPPTSVVALDNRTFRTLDDWGVDLSAGAVALMPDELSYTDDESILDVGNHREPNLEAIVEAEPDLVISGQRFSQHNDAIAQLAPGAAIIDLTPREGEPFGPELERQVTELGPVFGKEAEAEQLVADFRAATERVRAAYDPAETVMGVITSGGEINYAAPGTGRGVGPVFELAELTPALEVADSSTDHEGDDISVEAIAQADPDWILAMDRDAAVGSAEGETYTPANELLASSPALTNVTAVQEDNIVYMPENAYIDESIQTYTEFLNSIADAMEEN